MTEESQETLNSSRQPESEMSGRECTVKGISYPTGWSLWFHPRRYAALWREREEELQMLRDLLLRSEGERERLAKVSFDIESITRAHEEARERYEKEIALLREEKNNLEQQLHEWEKTQEELEKFEEVVEKFNKQKDKYEAQIASLRNDLRTQSLQLRDLQQRRDPSMPERPRKMINMDASPEPPRKPSVDDTDWFDPLPDF